METIKTLLEEKDQAMATLRDELNSFQSNHSEQLLAKESQISELQEQIYVLKTKGEDGTPSSSSSSPKISTLQDESLSPETRQSISHLKQQLRKAHAGK